MYLSNPPPVLEKTLAGRTVVRDDPVTADPSSVLLVLRFSPYL